LTIVSLFYYSVVSVASCVYVRRFTHSNFIETFCIRRVLDYCLSLYSKFVYYQQ